tara:strand:- start:8944 stop:9210 length:267 start_codon:yes stop_codon:yes gene_type:complete
VSKTEQKILSLTREIEQRTARLSDLKQKSKEDKRRADTRKKIIYGGAYFAYLASLAPEQATRVEAAFEKMIINKKDRQFLELTETNSS